MSPEQASAGEIDGRSDLYSLGIILYEMLVGEVPFTGSSTPTVLIKHVTEMPVAGVLIVLALAGGYWAMTRAVDSGTVLKNPNEVPAEPSAREPAPPTTLAMAS